MNEDFRNLVLLLARSLVDEPDAVSLSEEDQGQKILYRLKVAESEKGKIIGRGGRTARAIRALLGAAAAKKGVRIELEIVDG
ncbi:KH domain-containing protein [Candidatus Fermentibacteria bacterium]|nr:KH domain-containing protein [Candidatus Fermentibacteria bacterium]